MDASIPADFKYPEFYDLICDALFPYKEQTLLVVTMQR
jgi:hypothetical protein